MEVTVSQLERQLAAAHDARDAQHTSVTASDSLACQLSADCAVLANQLAAAAAECAGLRGRLAGAATERVASGRLSADLRRECEGLERRLVAAERDRDALAATLRGGDSIGGERSAGLVAGAVEPAGTVMGGRRRYITATVPQCPLPCAEFSSPLMRHRN